MKLRFRAEAQPDLREIGDFIARDNREAARRFVRFLRAKCRILAANPYIGRECPELSAGLRNYPVQRHMIFYRVLGDAVEIVNIVHGSRDIEVMF